MASADESKALSSPSQHPDHNPPLYENACSYPTAAPPQIGAYSAGLQPNFGSLPPPPPTTSIRTVIIGSPEFSPYPCECLCPNCHNHVTFAAGLLAWLLCGLLIIFGFWLGCCFIPFCIDSCQDVEHYCPNCGAFLGSYRRI